MNWIAIKDQKPPICTNLIFCLEKDGKRDVVVGWDERDTEECDVYFSSGNDLIDSSFFDWNPIAWMPYEGE